MVRWLSRVLPKTAVNKFIFGRTAQKTILVAALVSVVGCVPSPEPEVEDIVKVLAPTFSGKADAFISSPSQAYSIQGECDPNAKSTEYSFDQNSWVSIECKDRRFTVPVVLSGYIDVWARSKGKFSLSEVAHARVRFLLPPTSDSIVAGNSSKSSNSDAFGPGTQNMMAASFEGTAPASTSVRIQTMLPRMVYEQ